MSCVSVAPRQTQKPVDMSFFRFFCFFGFFGVTRSQVQNPVMNVTIHRMQTKTCFIFRINQSIYLINQQLHTFIFNSFLFTVGYFLKELS